MNLFASNFDPVAQRRAAELPAAIADCLRRGGTVVAGNRRAARALRVAYASGQRLRGLESWPTARIADWDGWLASLWQQALLSGGEAPLLLSALQERSIWRRIAVEHGAARQVVSPEALAQLAQEAWQLLSAYNAHDTRNRSWLFAGLEDAEVFRAWAATFTAECSRNNWLSRAGLEHWLAGAIATGRIPAPADVLLVGFDRITPAQQSLLDRLPASRLLEDSAAAGPAALVEALDNADQISACAWWIRSLLQRDPAIRVAVIAPDSERLRGEIARIFRGVLTPRSLGIDGLRSTPAFEFSLGLPLAHVPGIRAALLLLRWFHQPLEEEQVTWLMLSGLLANEAETGALAVFDAGMRDRSVFAPEIPLDLWLHRLRQRGGDALLPLHQRLDDLRRALASQPRRAPFSRWADWVDAALHSAGWPGASPQGSVAYQARRKWEQVLDAVAALDFDASRAAYSDFVTTLERAAADSIFAPESIDAPVQIMGPLESAGQRFDALWFLGADDSQWPATGRPHPLLPPALQRAAGMPHATPESDTRLALAVTERLLHSSAECVFSYATQGPQGALGRSPILTAALPHAPVERAAELRARLEAPAPVHRVPQTISVPDALGPPWPSHLPARGSETLRRQAACPFQAFAAIRLGARELNRAQWGLSPAERGTVLHRVLEGLWSPETAPELRLGTRDDLIQAIASGHLSSLLSHHIDHALQHWTADADRWTRSYLSGEKDRLLELLGQWLRTEARRKPFTVEAVEKRLNNVQVGGLRLNLRADRIDRLPDGAGLIFDYKTGKVSASSWLGERPEEPQLPLYAVFGGVHDLRGMLFAQLRAGDSRLVGLVKDADNALGAKADGLPVSGVEGDFGDSTLEQWRAALEQLAGEFLRGEAAVAPRHYPDTCKYCALAAVCRVAESQVPMLAAASEDADEAEEPEAQP